MLVTYPRPSKRDTAFSVISALLLRNHLQRWPIRVGREPRYEALLLGKVFWSSKNAMHFALIETQHHKVSISVLSPPLR
jgi:hypothetical protein